MYIFRRVTCKLSDRWGRFDPERPPYMFGPERSKSTNHQLVIFSSCVLTVLSYLLFRLIDHRQAKIEETIQANPRQYINPKQERNGLMVEQALIEHEIRMRRHKLGLPPRTSGIVEIVDFDVYSDED